MSDNPAGFSEGPAPDFSHLTEAERDAALVVEGLADLAAGRCVPHEDVAAWLDTWGKGERVPPPASWFK